MTHLKQGSETLTEIAEKIALSDFEQEAQDHQFSEKYQQKKVDFLESISQAEAIKRRKNYKKRLLGITAGLLIGIPVTAYGAVKLYEVIVNKNQYQLEVAVKNKKPNNQVAKNYKMDLGYLPEGIIQDEHQKNKYSYQNNLAKGGFSFSLWKTNQKADFKNIFVDNYLQKQLGGHQAILMRFADNEEQMMFNRQAYLFFEEEGYVLETFIGEDVPETEIEKTLAAITLTETTKENATFFQDYDEYLSRVEEEANKTSVSRGLDANSPRLGKIGDTITPTIHTMTPDGKENEVKVNFTISQVEILDTLEELDPKGINSYFKEEFEENHGLSLDGKLQTVEQKKYQAGDGKTSLNKLIEVKQVQPKFVYITATLENPTNQVIDDLYYQNGLSLLVEKAGKWVNSSSLGEEANYFHDWELLTGEVDYLSSHGEGKNFYRMPEIKPYEKRIIQIGYVVAEEDLSKLFLNAFYTGGPSEIKNKEGNSEIVDDLNERNRWWIDIRQ